MGDVPFADVYINPTVLNIEGKRMSKSLGTGLDPLDYVEQGYGADALRYALALRCSQGQQDLRFGEKMLEDVRNFNNKIWNASRFVRTHLEGFTPARAPAPDQRSVIDRWIRSRYARLVRRVTAHLEAYDFDKAARALYDFIWSEYCDWYVEFSKVDLYRDDLPEGRRLALQHTLWSVLEGTLRLLHPVMPHITEEIWQSLPHQGESIVIAPWPTAGADEEDPAAEAEVEVLMAAIRAIRSLRADLGLPPSARVAPRVAGPADRLAVIERHRDHVARLARADLRVVADGEREPGAVGTIAAGLSVSLAVAPTDRPRARRRLEQELQRVRAAAARTAARLADGDFLARAPAEVVVEERRREEELRARQQILAGYLAALD
jgi:valyl-tRNA synthetase